MLQNSLQAWDSVISITCDNLFEIRHDFIRSDLLQVEYDKIHGIRKFLVVHGCRTACDGHGYGGSGSGISR